MTKLAVLAVVTMLGPQSLAVRPQVGIEPLDIEISVRATQSSRALYVAVSDSLGAIVSSSRDVMVGQSRYTFEFKHLAACECEVSAYSVEPNELRLLETRTLIVMERGR